MQTTLTPGVDQADLIKRLGLGPADTEEATRVMTVAGQLLDEALTTAETADTLPEQETYDDMLLTVAGDLWARRRAATRQLTATADAPAGPRPPRDPLASIRSMLGRYVVPL